MNRPRLRLPHRGHRVSARIVAAGSSAIIAIYAAGYMETRFVDDQRDLQALAALAAATAPPARAPSAQATPPPLDPDATPYRDGIYAGSGRGPHGSVEVSVVIEGGLIVSAEITACGTRYPCDRIAALPGQVVQTQDLMQITKVSGATDSTFAYIRAVAAALRQAEA